MIVLVTRGEELPNKKKLIAAIQKEIPSVKSIVQNINSKKTNVIFGSKTVVLWGEEYIYDSIGSIKFAISARSFYQVNPKQTKVLYDKTLEYAALKGHETVIDAYCGIGTISLFLAQKAKQVYGVEVVPEAIPDAKSNARLNHFDNVTFAVGEAEKVMRGGTRKVYALTSLSLIRPERLWGKAARNDFSDEARTSRLRFL